MGLIHEHNAQSISLREGSVFIDGVEVMDSVTCTINVTPDVHSGRQLGDITPSRKWLGADITGSITRRRSTPWLKEKVKQYFNTKRTPELTIQGIMNDANSDYFAAHGTDVVTCVGCVITGDIPLTRLDSNGDMVDDVINFAARKFV